MKIAITGGIGSGKSYVCRLLEKRGIYVYDCDDAAKRLMHTSETIREELTKLIGSGVYDSEGRLNKALVTQFLLASEENTKELNAVVHPAVAEDFLVSGCQWMESAILFESGFYRLVDRVICVTAPEEIRIQRIMHRDSITHEKALEWINKQMPQEEVLKRSHFEIRNDGSCNMEEQIDSIINNLK